MNWYNLLEETAMSSRERGPRTPPEVVSHYDRAPEETRLESGPFRLEFVRTKELLARVLPAPPATVADVGGGAGAYSAWLAGLGYQVHLLDASPRLIEEARRRHAARERPIASIAVGDACELPFDDGSIEAVLLMGPLYHLPESEDRSRALGEAWRVLSHGGVLAAAAISRFSSALAGLTLRLAGDSDFISLSSTSTCIRNPSRISRPGGRTRLPGKRPPHLSKSTSGKLCR